MKCVEAKSCKAFKTYANSQLVLDVSLPVFLSKIRCVATSHSSDVMINITFPVMDEVIQVSAMAEFIHQDYATLVNRQWWNL